MGDAESPTGHLHQVEPTQAFLLLGSTLSLSSEPIKPSSQTILCFLDFTECRVISFLLTMCVPLCHRRTVPRGQRSLRGEAVSRGYAVCWLRSQQETVPLPVSTGKARRVLRCRVQWDDEGLNSYSGGPCPWVNYTALALPEDILSACNIFLQNEPQLASPSNTWNLLQLQPMLRKHAMPLGSLYNGRP